MSAFISRLKQVFTISSITFALAILPAHADSKKMDSGALVSIIAFILESQNTNIVEPNPSVEFARLVDNQVILLGQPLTVEAISIMSSTQ